MIPQQPLIRRYVILKVKLQEEIEYLDDVTKGAPHLLSSFKTTKQVVEESLRLLEDTFSGEDEEIT